MSKGLTLTKLIGRLGLLFFAGKYLSIALHALFEPATNFQNMDWLMFLMGVGGFSVMVTALIYLNNLDKKFLLKPNFESFVEKHQKKFWT